MKRTDESRSRAIANDSVELGIDGAAKRHGVSRRTVIRHRVRHGVTAYPEPLAPVPREARTEAFIAMRDRYEAALIVTLNKLEELVQTSTSLRDVAGALKILSEAHAATRILDLGYAPIDATDADGSPLAPTAQGHLERQRGAIRIFARSTVYPLNPPGGIDAEGGDAPA